MKRRTMIATTAIFALTAAMLFAGVANAQQPTTATTQNTYGATPQVLGHNAAAGNDASAYGYGHWGGWGGCGHWGGWGGCHHWRC